MHFHKNKKTKKCNIWKYFKLINLQIFAFNVTITSFTVLFVYFLTSIEIL